MNKVIKESQMSDAQKLLMEETLTTMKSVLEKLSVSEKTAFIETIKRVAISWGLPINSTNKTRNNDLIMRAIAVAVALCRG